MCAMLVIAATYFRRMTNISVTPFTYADNWTFMSTDERSLFRALIGTLNFAQTLKMKIDLNRVAGEQILSCEDFGKVLKSYSLGTTPYRS